MTGRACFVVAAVLTALMVCPVAAHAAPYPAGWTSDRSGPIWGDCPPDVKPHP
jgi:hypothetical protein